MQTFEDAALIRQVLESDGHGRILIVDAGASRRMAVLGDRMGRIGMEHGWAGVLVYGAVRDVDVLKELNFGVWALGSVPSRGGKTGVGSSGVALSIAGTAIKPGDFVAIDSDGVVIVDSATPGL